MKKRKAVILIVVFSAFILIGCGSSSEETNSNNIDPISRIMIEDIDSIGEVTVEDESFIAKLLQRYESLTDEQKSQISNYNDLVNANTKLEQLKKEDAKPVEPVEEPIEEVKEPWDLTGCWCTESVEKGEPGMAAFVTEDKMILYHVSDKQDVYTPYRIGTYEVNKGKEIFSWTSINDLSYETVYPLYSYDETKEFKYENGTISYTLITNEEEIPVELHRTTLDFSYDENVSNTGVSEDLSLGLYEFRIPSSFGFYRETGEDDHHYYFYISKDALIKIFKTADNTEFEKLTDKEFEKAFRDMCLSSKNSWLKDNKNSKLIDEKNDSIAGGLGYMCRITGISWDGMEGDVFLSYFGSRLSKAYYAVCCYVSYDTKYDYWSDFTEMISGIKANDDFNKSIALSALTKEEDEVEKTTYYKPTKYPKHTDDRTFMLPYIVTDGKDVSLHLVLDYYGKDWVFYDKVILAVDDERHEIVIPPERKKEDISYGGVIEVTDLGSLSSSDIGTLRRIPDSQKTIVRFDGGSSKFDYTLTEEDKQGFADIFNAYDALKR